MAGEWQEAEDGVQWQDMLVAWLVVGKGEKVAELGKYSMLVGYVEILTFRL